MCRLCRKCKWEKTANDVFFKDRKTSLSCSLTRTGITKYIYAFQAVVCGSDSRGCSIVLISLYQPGNTVRTPALVFRNAGTKKSSNLTANSGEIKTQYLIKMLVVYPALTFHCILQRHDTSSCFFAYTGFTLCHKNRESKKVFVVTR